MGRPAAIYARVSTDGQAVENQIRELEAVAERAGWRIVDVFADRGVSGARGRDKRPELDRLLRGAVHREFGLVMVWSVDRLGRSLQHLVDLLAELQAAGVDLYLHQQNLDTTTPSGRAMFQMCGVFAEFERAMIRERVKAGLGRARERGTRLGRPPVGAEVEARILELRGEQLGKRKIARALGVGMSTVQRVLRSAEREGEGRPEVDG